MNLSIKSTLVTVENDLLKSGSLSVLPVISETNFRSLVMQDHISSWHHHSLRVDGVTKENIFYPDVWQYTGELFNEASILRMKRSQSRFYY